MNCDFICVLLSSFLIILLFQYVVCNDGGSNIEAPIVIVFGGNGFVGSYIVESLLYNGYLVHTVHRGNAYWEYSTFNVAEYPEQAGPLTHHAQSSAFSNIPTKSDSPTLSNSLYSTSSLFAGKVMHSDCDRDRPLTECRSLTEFIERVPKVDYVLDATAQTRVQVENAADLVAAKTGFYILISTDEVYKVCVRPHESFTARIAEHVRALGGDAAPFETRRLFGLLGPARDDSDWVESACSRPNNATQSRILGTLFPLAHNKLAAEEALHLYHLGPARLNYLVVRAAPFVGARDTTFAALSDDAKRFDRKAIVRALNELADKRPDPIPPDSPVGRPSSPALDAYWALDYLRANDLLDRLEPGYPLRPASQRLLVWTLAVGVAASTGRALLVPAALRESRFQLLGVEEIAALLHRVSELRLIAEHRFGGRLAYTLNLAYPEWLSVEQLLQELARSLNASAGFRVEYMADASAAHGNLFYPIYFPARVSAR